jgi:hypothetical protein
MSRKWLPGEFGAPIKRIRATRNAPSPPLAGSEELLAALDKAQRVVEQYRVGKSEKEVIELALAELRGTITFCREAWVLSSALMSPRTADRTKALQDRYQTEKMTPKERTQRIKGQRGRTTVFSQWRGREK